MYSYLPIREEKELILGKFNTISYDKQTVNLKIVPVNETTDLSTADFTKEINNIYKQSVVEWNITLDDVFYIDKEDWDNDGDDVMNDGESTLLSKYSDEHNKLRRKYKRQTTIDNQTYYVFLLNGIESKSQLAGYMPLKSQYGFIYSGNIDTRTIAHELAHVQRKPGFCDFKKQNPMVELIPPELCGGGSAFRLWHTFSTESDFLLPQNTSDNLMDYNDGERLHKYQWDYIHNPEGGLYLFQDEEEAAMIASGDSIEIEIESFKTEFAPGVGNLELKYKLSELSKQVVDKYPNEDFKIHFAIADKDKDIVYKQTVDAKEQGTFEWNGYLNENKSDSVTYENGPYKLATTITLGNVDIDEWQDIKDYTYELVFSDSVRVISHSIDTSFNILNDPIKLDWLANIETYSTNYNLPQN